jgi:hypothetical protein
MALSYPQKQGIGWVVGGAVLAAMLWLAWQVPHKTEMDPFITILSCLAGVALGALLGSLASPRGDHESTQFKEFSKIAATFIGGFTLSRIAELFDDFLRTELNMARLLLLLVSAVFAGIALWAFRAYAIDPGPSPEKKVGDAIKDLLNHAQRDPATGHIAPEFGAALATLAARASKECG